MTSRTIWHRTSTHITFRTSHVAYPVSCKPCFIVSCLILSHIVPRIISSCTTNIISRFVLDVPGTWYVPGYTRYYIVHCTEVRVSSVPLYYISYRNIIVSHLVPHISYLVSLIVPKYHRITSRSSYIISLIVPKYHRITSCSSYIISLIVPYSTMVTHRTFIPHLAPVPSLRWPPLRSRWCGWTGRRMRHLEALAGSCSCSLLPSGKLLGYYTT